LSVKGGWRGDDGCCPSREDGEEMMVVVRQGRMVLSIHASSAGSIKDKRKEDKRSRGQEDKRRAGRHC
jgi:hypothetical protein